MTYTVPLKHSRDASLYAEKLINYCEWLTYEPGPITVEAIAEERKRSDLANILMVEHPEATLRLSLAWNKKRSKVDLLRKFQELYEEYANAH